MKINKLYFIIGIPVVVIVLLIIYGYNQPKHNEQQKFSLVEFKKEINANEYVLVYFNASWCMVCSKMKPIIDDIETDYKTLKIIRVNTDDNKEIAVEFEINSLPAFMLYHKGVIVWTEIGVMSSSELKTKLNYLK